MFGSRGRSSKISRSSSSQPPDPVSSLAAQAAALTFNKNKEKQQDQRPREPLKKPSSNQIPLSSHNNVNSPSRSSTPIKSRGSFKTGNIAINVKDTNSPSSSSSSYSAIPKPIKRRVVSRQSSHDITPTSRPDSAGGISSGNNSNINVNNNNQNAIKAAATAAKKVSGIATENRSMGNLTNTGFLPPSLPSDTSKQLMRPPSSPVLSSYSASSTVEFSPGGLISKKMSGDCNNGSEESFSHQSIPFESDLRSRSEGPLDNKRYSLNKIKNIVDHDQNLSYVSLNDLNEADQQRLKANQSPRRQSYQKTVITSEYLHSPYQLSNISNNNGNNLLNLSQLSLNNRSPKPESLSGYYTPPNKSQLDISSSEKSKKLDGKTSLSSLKNHSKIRLEIPSVNEQRKLSTSSSPYNCHSPKLYSYDDLDKTYDDDTYDYSHNQEDHYLEEDGEEEYESDFEKYFEEDDDKLPQYPNFFAANYKSKKHKLGIKKKGKKMLRDLGIKPDYKMNHRRTDVSHLQDGTSSQIGGSQKPVEFRTTMRDNSKKSQQYFNVDKPWKHHNDALSVSAAEKKRYEGVWVANRGLYMGLNKKNSSYINIISDSSVSEDINHPSQLIHGYVVRNLWRRSNLADDILSNIWDLVDLEKRSIALNRYEFIVGMWLVDQCLYGRKLPKSLDESVWNSVKRLVPQTVKTKKNILGIK